jgi:hypothetical protein
MLSGARSIVTTSGAGDDEMNERQRTWSASIEVRTAYQVVAFDATPSEYDLLRDQTDAAVREAASLVDVDGARDVTVVLWKRTAARGLERDRSFAVYRDKHGDLRYQR